jgi:uncharacterized protein (DUF433 family)
MAATTHILTPREAAYVANVPHRAVQQAIDRNRIARPFAVRTRNRRGLTPAGVLLMAADYRVGRSLSATARAKLRQQIAANADPHRVPAVKSINVSTEPPEVLVVLEKLRDEISERLTALQKALRMIVEDPDVQGGAPTFRGTRIVARLVAAAVARGVPADELFEDYGLTPQMLEAACIYAEVRPARGRPVKERAPDHKHRTHRAAA